MSLLPKPRIHDVVLILITHDFLFNSQNLAKYYKICEPILKVGFDWEAFKKRREYYSKISWDLKQLVLEELKTYSKKYKIHGLLKDLSYFTPFE